VARDDPNAKTVSSSDRGSRGNASHRSNESYRSYGALFTMLTRATPIALELARQAGSLCYIEPLCLLRSV